MSESGLENEAEEPGGTIAAVAILQPGGGGGIFPGSSVLVGVAGAPVRSAAVPRGAGTRCCSSVKGGET